MESELERREFNICGKLTKLDSEMQDVCETGRIFIFYLSSGYMEFENFRREDEFHHFQGYYRRNRFCLI